MTGIRLRAYQEGAIGKLRSALARGARRVLLYSPTGSGKTEMAFVMVVGALAKGRKVMFIANRKELVRQASRRLDAAGIAHGILQAENTRIRHGVKAAHLDYHHTDDERAEILDAFARGEITVLSNSALLAEGWDCPSTEVMILARPTKSLIRYVQMVGRVLRPARGKERALLLDHSGTVLRLGFATDDLPLELDDGTANTSASKKRERKASEPRPCPRCKFVRDAGVHECPKCGLKPQRQSDVAVADGELVKIDRKRKKSAAGHFEKSATFAGLLHIADERGYSQGWASHKYREIFGVWPKGLLGIAEGIETALAASELFETPVWSCISTAGIESFEPPAGVDHVIIFADHDENFAGQKAAFAAAHRLKLKGFGVEVCIPPTVGDWLDELNRRAQPMQHILG